MPAHSILIMDGQEIVRLGLEALVAGCPSLRLVGSVSRLAEGLRLIAELQPELVTTEMALRDSMGLDTVRSVLRAQGERYTLVVSAQDEMLYGEQVLSMGADGYVMKENAHADLIPAALAVLEGQRWMSPALNAMLLKRVLERRRHTAGGDVHLTARELQVLDHLQVGKSTKEIAAALHLSVRTIDLYRASIKRKLGLRSGAELIAFASSHRLDPGGGRHRPGDR